MRLLTHQVTRYLARIGDPPRSLAALHVAHLAHVAFENLSIHRGEPVVLEIDALYEKIVERGRGGFCYELNGLFAALLGALGHRVDLLAARVGPDGIPFDHMCLRVDDVWLADVGFGDSFVTPLRLDTPKPQSDGRRTFRIANAGDTFTVLDGDKPMYRAEQRAYALADFEPGRAYHTTSPDSHFTKGTVVSRLLSNGRVTLRDDRLIETAFGVKHETPVPDRATWDALYRAHF